MILAAGAIPISFAETAQADCTDLRPVLQASVCSTQSVEVSPPDSDGYFKASVDVRGWVNDCTGESCRYVPFPPAVPLVGYTIECRSYPGYEIFSAQGWTLPAFVGYADYKHCSAPGWLAVHGQLRTGALGSLPDGRGEVALIDHTSQPTGLSPVVTIEGEERPGGGFYDITITAGDESITR